MQLTQHQDIVGQEEQRFGGTLVSGGGAARPAPPTPGGLPVDVVVPVQVQDATGHLARHPLQGQRVRGHGVGPPAAPQVSLQVTLRGGATVTPVPSCPKVLALLSAGARAEPCQARQSRASCLPTTMARRSAARVATGASHGPAAAPWGHGGLTSGQNSITSRYGVTSAHWARHCSRLVCWRALRGAERGARQHRGACRRASRSWGWQHRGGPPGARGLMGRAGSGYHCVPAPRDTPQRGICSALTGHRPAPCPPLPPCP